MAKEETLHYNNAAIRPRRGGWQADIMRGGRRYRRQFGPGHKGVAAAKNYINQVDVEHRANERILSLTEIDHARKALDLLPDSVSLLDAASYYVDHHKRVVEQPLLTTAAERYVDEKIRTGRREATIRSARIQSNRLAKAFPETTVNKLTRQDLLRWLDGRNFKSPVTRNNYIRDISGFLAWCVEQGYATKNVAATIPNSAVDDDLPAVYDVATVQQMLRYLEQHEPRLVAFHALGFFAGVRTTELERLHLENIQGPLLQVTPRAAKTRSWRYIEMEPNLQEWLAAYPPDGPIQNGSRYTIEAARRGAGCWPWVQNVMRHSFATYHLARYRDAARTAHDLGHPNANLVYTRYRALAEKAEGEKYFAIHPAR